MIIPFSQECRRRYYQLLDNVFDSNFWSEGPMQRLFEQKFSEFIGVESRAVVNCGAGLLAIMDYIDVRGKEVIVPANTFWATSQAVRKAGGRVVFADSNREDLCLSFNDLVKRVTTDTKVVIVVHIGGHIAFDIEEIADYCRRNDIFLVEDCAHAHGASWNGMTAGRYGFAGVYSFYATKTLPTGDGGMVVSGNSDFLLWLEKYRNYGKEIVGDVVTYPVKNGFNLRMNEMTAALGVVQMERIQDILEWKRALAEKYDLIFDSRVKFPEGMISGYYKYIVFNYESISEETGQVFGYNDLGHVIEGADIDLENAEWIAANHKCVPIYYGWEKGEYDIAQLRDTLLP